MDEVGSISRLSTLLSPRLGSAQFCQSAYLVVESNVRADAETRYQCTRNRVAGVRGAAYGIYNDGIKRIMPF